MSCPDCDTPLVPFVVPPELREYAPTTSESLAICSQCLSLIPTPTAPDDENADFSPISDSFPTGEAGVSMALALGLLESLALNRTEIEQLLERVERAGADPLLLLDRLDRQGNIQPRWDIARRRHQLEQFLNDG